METQEDSFNFVPPIKHWGEIDEQTFATDSATPGSRHQTKRNSKESLTTLQSMNKLTSLPSAPTEEPCTYSLDSKLDGNMMKSVKLMEQLVSSGTGNIAGDTAFIIADFTEESTLSHLEKSQCSPMTPAVDLETICNPFDARLLLNKSISVLLMHNEIFHCKRSVLECFTDLAEKFFKNVGMQLSSASTFGSTTDEACLEEAEIALHNVGISGITDVVRYYRRNVLHKHVFLEANVNLGLTKGVIKEGN